MHAYMHTQSQGVVVNRNRHFFASCTSDVNLVQCCVDLECLLQKCNPRASNFIPCRTPKINSVRIEIAAARLTTYANVIQFYVPTGLPQPELSRPSPITIPSVHHTYL